MRILALQLKRIGDLVLTTPALAALRHAMPDAHITLVAAKGCADLLPALDFVDEALVFRRSLADVKLCAHIATKRFDVCLDFTGNDRSAFLARLSMAPRRIAFDAVRSGKIRALAYNEFVDSPVRDSHTVDHYLDLAQALSPGIAPSELPVLNLPKSARSAASETLECADVRGPFAIIHPGSARPEKYWAAEHWSRVCECLRDAHGLKCLITGGRDPFEREHIAEILAHAPQCAFDISGQSNLLTLAALVERARLVVSCDTGIVHLAAAFQTPQIALFGPTNPFHWRPRHPRALVISAAQPETPLREFQPRMKGAPMERISTAVVIDAIGALLSDSSSSSSSSSSSPDA